MKRLYFIILFLLLCCSSPGEEPAQWVVVTAPDFHDLITPLCEHRRAEGLQVTVIVTTETLSEEQIQKGNVATLVERIHALFNQSKNSGYLLLVGSIYVDDPKNAVLAVVPSPLGQTERMKGLPSDIGYGCPDDSMMPKIAVGRFPARNREEARIMVQKTLDFENNNDSGSWRNRLLFVVGHPGGRNVVEKRMGEWFVDFVANGWKGQIHPSWNVTSFINGGKSTESVSLSVLREKTLKSASEGQMFFCYLGHSGPNGLWSQGVTFMNREDWRGLRIEHGPGIFISCGCYCCQLKGEGGEGYGLVAMRNPGGPVAVMGAQMESHSAMGHLAFQGLLQCFKLDKRMERLADYWLAVETGLTSGEMDEKLFLVYDNFDGSGGRVPLSVQRREHLEMWMLLGDPALEMDNGLAID